MRASGSALTAAVHARRPQPLLQTIQSAGQWRRLRGYLSQYHATISLLLIGPFHTFMLVIDSCRKLKSSS